MATVKLALTLKRARTMHRQLILAKLIEQQKLYKHLYNQSFVKIKLSFESDKLLISVLPH